MRKVNRALVVFNPKKPHAKELARDVRRFIRASGAEVVMDAKDADLLVIISGDGTLLYNKLRYNLPIFAIGSERSFICQAHAGNWRDKLARILSDGYEIERRTMLSCAVNGARMEDALNEIVVHSRNHRVVDIELLVGRRRFAFYADGVMFSTPTGSSAYCYSCGGRELPKHARKYEIVAIAPYRRAFTYAIVPDSVTASAVVKSNNADLISDGQFIHHLKAGSIIKVWKSSRAIELVKA